MSPVPPTLYKGHSVRRSLVRTSLSRSRLSLCARLSLSLSQVAACLVFSLPLRTALLRAACRRSSSLSSRPFTFFAAASLLSLLSRLFSLCCCGRCAQHYPRPFAFSRVSPLPLLSARLRLWPAPLASASPSSSSSSLLGSCPRPPTLF